MRTAKKDRYVKRRRRSSPGGDAVESAGHGLVILYINPDGAVSASSQASWKLQDGRLAPPKDVTKESVRLVLSNVPAAELREGHFSYEAKRMFEVVQREVTKPFVPPNLRVMVEKGSCLLRDQPGPRSPSSWALRVLHQIREVAVPALESWRAANSDGRFKGWPGGRSPSEEQLASLIPYLYGPEDLIAVDVPRLLLDHPMRAQSLTREDAEVHGRFSPSGVDDPEAWVEARQSPVHGWGVFVRPGRVFYKDDVITLLVVEETAHALPPPGIECPALLADGYHACLSYEALMERYSSGERVGIGSLVNAGKESANARIRFPRKAGFHAISVVAMKKIVGGEEVLGRYSLPRGASRGGGGDYEA